MSDPGLAARVAALDEATETGQWQRHAPVRHAGQALDGWISDARWGTATGFPVLYLGRPTNSVIVEAYRHQVDPIMFDDPDDRDRFLAGLMPRVLVTCTVRVTLLLDLRSAAARAAVGLTIQDLSSAVNDRDSYERCQTVAQVAHQLGRHGVLAPAATGVGETLALFTDRLPVAERPARAFEDRQWAHLPPDPRQALVRALRVVTNES